ncbi:MAG: N-acetylmannosamine-6-phosphate 2-epimerase [Clostridia bacterium]|nr:N-acetylmannosamine-6-phosphate 2-epimerase [Clostridia bacterium]
MNTLEKIKGGLVVSCQALPHEPMHSSFIMGRFARAAVEGGAVGIRANTREDIAEIKKNVSVPIIGIVKRDYPDCPVYITPTMKEIYELMEVGVEIIAIDATKRPRPNGQSLDDFVSEIRGAFDGLLMADVSDYEEAKKAHELGFDIISTTMRGYTDYTKGVKIPDFDLIERLVKDFPDTAIIAEGGIKCPEDLRLVMERGVHCAVVGGAITRPKGITEDFVAAIK